MSADDDYDDDGNASRGILTKRGHRVCSTHNNNGTANDDKTSTTRSRIFLCTHHKHLLIHRDPPCNILFKQHEYIHIFEHKLVQHTRKQTPHARHSVRFASAKHDVVAERRIIAAKSCSLCTPKATLKTSTLTHI